MKIYMAFCTSCGEKLQPGSKFCENCGAPVEATAAPAPAGPADAGLTPAREPLVPSPPPAKPVPVPLIIGILVVLAVIAAAAWFVGLPYLQKQQASTATTPVPTATPVRVTTMSTMPVATTVTPTATVRKLEGRYEAYYDEIHTLNKFFEFGQTETFTYDLTTPPLYIKYNLEPGIISREKVINIGLSTEETITLTYPNPNAWFEIKVIDANNGAVVEARGYGKDYPDVTKSEFMVRSPGTFRIEFSGHDVNADVSVLVGENE